MTFSDISSRPAAWISSAGRAAPAWPTRSPGRCRRPGSRCVERGQGAAAQRGVGGVAGGGEVVELLVVAGDAEVGRGDRAQGDEGVEEGVGDPVDVGPGARCWQRQWWRSPAQRTRPSAAGRRDREPFGGRWGRRPPGGSAGEGGRAPAVRAGGHRRPHQPGAVGPGRRRADGRDVAAAPAPAAASTATAAASSSGVGVPRTTRSGGASLSGRRPGGRSARRSQRDVPVLLGRQRLALGAQRAQRPDDVGRGSRTAGSRRRRSRARPRRRGWRGCPRTR